MISNAFKLSRTCSGLLAPRMIVLVFGFLATQAKARWVTLQPSSAGASRFIENHLTNDVPVSASLLSSLTLLIFSRPSSSLRFLTVSLKMSEWVAKRDSGGMPSLYWKHNDQSRNVVEQLLEHLPSEQTTSQRWPHCDANGIFLIERGVFFLGAFTMQHATSSGVFDSPHYMCSKKLTCADIVQQSEQWGLACQRCLYGFNGNRFIERICTEMCVTHGVPLRYPGQTTLMLPSRRPRIYNEKRLVTGHKYPPSPSRSRSWMHERSLPWALLPASANSKAHATGHWLV